MHKSNAIIFMCSCCCVYCNCICLVLGCCKPRYTSAHTYKHTLRSAKQNISLHTHTRERAHTVRDENEIGWRWLTGTHAPTTCPNASMNRTELNAYPSRWLLLLLPAACCLLLLAAIAVAAAVIACLPACLSDSPFSTWAHNSERARERNCICYSVALSHKDVTHAGGSHSLCKRPNRLHWCCCLTVTAAATVKHRSAPLN